jgi:hypothetical protein
MVFFSSEIKIMSIEYERENYLTEEESDLIEYIRLGAEQRMLQEALKEVSGRRKAIRKKNGRIPVSFGYLEKKPPKVSKIEAKESSSESESSSSHGMEEEKKEVIPPPKKAVTAVPKGRKQKTRAGQLEEIGRKTKKARTTSTQTVPTGDPSEYS